MGANAKAKNFYSRTKGEVEAALRAENLPSLRIFRPSLLSGNRDEFRLKEQIGNVVFWFMAPVFHLGLRRYQPIKIEKVARALIKTSTNAAVDDRVRIYESDELQTF